MLSMNVSTRLPAGREARQAELTAPQCFDAIAKRRGPFEVQFAAAAFMSVSRRAISASRSAWVRKTSRSSRSTGAVA